MAPDGTKIWEWDIYGHVNPLEYEDIYKMRKDWSHGNSLAFDKDGNYLVSFRNFHQVWKINSSTGEIIWKLGKGGDFDIDPSLYFYSQHAAHLNLFDEVMLFDNGGSDRKTSRALSFRIENDGKIYPGQINVSLPANLFSFKEGSVYLIENDKLLFCSTRTNYIVITDFDGNILWKLRTSDDYYRATYIEASDL